MRTTARTIIVVMGVRKGESKFRAAYYNAVFFTRDYDGVKAKVWAPLLYVDEQTLIKLIERFGIPKNPVWRFGFSGECLCLAGAPVHEVALILRYFPNERNMLLDIDRIINENRKTGRPSAPFRVSQAGFRTLREFYEHVVRTQLTLDMYMPYRSCEGACLL